LAGLYLIQSRYAEAEPLYRRALAIWEKTRGPEHPDTADAVNALAVIYYRQGRDAGAEPLYRRALAISEKVLGLEHPRTAISLANLGRLRTDQEDWSDAYRLLSLASAIEIRRARRNAD